MPATQQDRKNLDELIRAHESYLRQMRLQHAQLGVNAPPHVVTEIERVSAELAQLRQAAAVPLSDGLVEEMGPVARYQLMFSHVTRLDTDIGRLRDAIKELAEQQRQTEQALRDRIDQLQYEVLRALGKRPRKPKAIA